ncbi:class I SAM-dependent RNA methyltransferase [Rothia sp. ZJ932]|uniref:class I SAM-dependent RNA methyltransferase n=1 Tax=Rothia sp. ZJ932 TaxID=2810516 RepID=UPI0019675CC7|nr:class I SAM-dependent RNA methyltransferase [Rothia sp. ZJ932]QRZ60878.1 class I SAM-dependent RNA methyltransferase [Rothia sp. ZJ932]
MTSPQENPLTPDTTVEVGSIVELTPHAVAHGGSFVARYNERVIFVRHGAIGETVRARITGAGPKNRFFFADVVEVLDPSEHRRTHPWVPADALRSESPIGGMEFAHLDPVYQRELKTMVVIEQLTRLGKVPASNALLKLLRVEELPGGDTGWRTRVHFDVAATGSGNRIGMYPHSSSGAVAVEDFPLAHPAVNRLQLHRLELENISRVDATVSSTGEILLSFTVRAGTSQKAVADAVTVQAEELWGSLKEEKITLVFTSERQGGRRRGERPADVVRGAQRQNPQVTEKLDIDDISLSWRVGNGGFWQIHPAAPEALGLTVSELLELTDGESVYDLYSGAGLFAAIAALEVGPTGYVLAVEGSPVTAANARDNFESGRARIEESADTRIETVKADVGAHLARLLPQVAAGKAKKPDAVIVDPSREGVGKKVVEQIDQLDPQRLVYVACDPAALGRDTGYLRELGWELLDLRAFDMYPNTHHVETVALFARAS